MGTGVDELDRLSYGDLEPAGLLYDHVITENEVDDHHHDKLEQMLADARQGFADMIQACRDDFQALVDIDELEADDRKAEVDRVLGDAVDAAADTQHDLGLATEQQLADDNAQRNT